MELFQLLGTVAIDSSQANKSLDDVAEKAGSSSGEVETAVNKIGTVAVGLAKGIATAGVAIGGAWIAALEGSRESQALLSKAFLCFQSVVAVS